jgi:hypothetical protein
MGRLDRPSKRWTSSFATSPANRTSIYARTRFLVQRGGASLSLPPSPSTHPPVHPPPSAPRRSSSSNSRPPLMLRPPMRMCASACVDVGVGDARVHACLPEPENRNGATAHFTGCEENQKNKDKI